MKKPELKTAIVEGLRTTELKQTRLMYQDGDRYCALGTICKILGQPAKVGVTGNWDFIDTIFELKEQWRIIKLNDIEGASFATVADFIEKL